MRFLSQLCSTHTEKKIYENTFGKIPPSPILWAVLWLLQARVLYQRPESLTVVRRISAVPRMVLFWTEVSDVISGISLMPLLSTSFPDPLSALDISQASHDPLSRCCYHLALEYLPLPPSYPASRHRDVRLISHPHCIDMDLEV